MWLLLALGAGFAGGCRDSRRLPVQKWSAEPGPVTVGAVTLDQSAPADLVARTMVGLLLKCDEVRRGGLGDPQRRAEFDTLREKIRRLAAANEIFKRAQVDRHMVPKDLTAESAVDLMTNQWPSIIAYYREDIRLEKAIENPIDEKHVSVAIPAENPRDRRALDEIERGLVDQRDVRGQPLRPGSESYNEALRRAAVARGISPRLESSLIIELAKVNDYWRVVAVRANGPPLSRTFAIHTTTPSSTTQRGRPATRPS
ncbi:MAG: hypothetical protein U1A27_00355 [Phycisphaerae bacterium]